MELIIGCLLLLIIIFMCKLMDQKVSKIVGLVGGWLVLFYITILNIYYNNSYTGFQYIYKIKLGITGLDLNIGVDGVSLCFLELTSLLIPICILVSWYNIQKRVKEFIILLLIVELLLFGVFIVLNIFWFYIFFEAVLIPMYLIIGFWGSRTRKVHAAFQFFLYTLFGSLFMLMGIINLLYSLGTLNIDNLIEVEIIVNRQLYIWLCLFIGFGVKIPILPFHIWLPEAHVEAPTAGSVLLAGILLKLGGYGFLRFVLPILPYANIYFSPIVQLIGVLGVIYGSIATIRQVDIKKIIAYSSVAHMGFVIMGIFSFNIIGIQGSILSMISHGLVSSGLFICIGLLYERFGSRLIIYYSGLISIMPLFGIFFMMLTLSNIGLPGTMSFVGEFYIMQGLFLYSSFLIIIGGLGVILGAVYSVWLLNRLLYGEIINVVLKKDEDLKFLLKYKLLLSFLYFKMIKDLVFSYKNCSVIGKIMKKDYLENGLIRVLLNYGSIGLKVKGEKLFYINILNIIKDKVYYEEGRTRLESSESRLKYSYKYSDIVQREFIILFIIIFFVIFFGFYPSILTEHLNMFVYEVLERYKIG